VRHVGWRSIVANSLVRNTRIIVTGVTAAALGMDPMTRASRVTRAIPFAGFVSLVSPFCMGTNSSAYPDCRGCASLDGKIGNTVLFTLDNLDKMGFDSDQKDYVMKMGNAAEGTESPHRRGIYGEAIAAIRDGQYEKGVDILCELGWIVEGKGNDALLAEYARSKAIEETKPDVERKSVMIVNATHKDAVTVAKAQSVADISLGFLSRTSLEAISPVLFLVMISRGRERSMVLYRPVP
jgi:hypothetical protein